MPHATETLKFKFKWLNPQGQETGFLRKHGELRGDVLVLDKAELPVAGLAEVAVRDNRLGVTVLNQEGKPEGCGITVSGGATARTLKMHIDVARSSHWAQMHKATLEKQGEGHLYRDETCPRCQATLILSRLEKSPQLYCHFCDTLMSIGDPRAVPAGEGDLKLCDACGMFSKPRKFTIFYFYFLLVVYGWRQQITWRCPACMRGDAWKMLFGNLVFVLGVPVAIGQLIRAYSGDVIGGPFKGLDGANLKARKGDYAGAIAKYRSILEQVHHSAGIKYNIGMGLLKEQPNLAVESFEGALKDCSNYAPAYRALSHCYQTMGQQAKLVALKKAWDAADEDAKEA